MEYSFLFKNNKILRTKSSTQELLYGYQTYKEQLVEHDITHHFRIVSLYAQEKDSEGNFYSWYYIDDYFNTIDCSSALKKENEELKSKIDYLSMMTEVDIPTNEEVVAHEQA